MCVLRYDVGPYIENVYFAYLLNQINIFRCRTTAQKHHDIRKCIYMYVSTYIIGNELIQIPRYICVTMHLKPGNIVFVSVHVHEHLLLNQILAATAVS